LDVSEHLLRQFFDDSPISVAVFDVDGSLVLFNHAFGAMLGYVPEELMKRKIDELLHPDDVPSLQERRRLLIEGRCAVLQMETRFKTADRREVWARICGRMQRTGGDRPAHIFAHIVDITELEHRLEAFQRDADEARWKSRDSDRYV
jgi:PAS domain S-box-containing protein